MKSDFDRLIDMLKNEVGDPRVDEIDRERLNQFVERRRSQVSSEKQKIVELEAWVNLRKKEASNRRQDMAVARAESIQEKLGELGWMSIDTENSLSAIKAKEYNSILCQPTLLNGSVWKRIRPRLENILAMRKAERLRLELQRIGPSRPTSPDYFYPTTTIEPGTWINTHENPSVSMPYLEGCSCDLVTADLNNTWSYRISHCRSYCIRHGSMNMVPEVPLGEWNGLSNDNWNSPIEQPKPIYVSDSFSGNPYHRLDDFYPWF